MNKIDRRHIYGIMLDTETANTIVEEDGKLNMRYVLPYDLGFAVIDTFGRVYETFSFANYDIYCKEKDLMKTAYYANKLPQYEKEIKEGKRLLRTTKTIRKILLDKIQEYDCKFVCAHNAFFDLTACNNIMRWTTKSKYRYFFPKDIEFWDTLKASRNILLKMPSYIKFCEKNNFMTKHKKPQPQLTAEVIYSYITNNPKFKEEHIGLQDVLIETKILNYLKKQHKSMNIKLFT